MVVELIVCQLLNASFFPSISIFSCFFSGFLLFFVLGAKRTPTFI